MRRAAFLDRDGTIVHDPGFLRNPADVRLIDGSAAAIRRLREAGFLVVVITNQSGIDRGMLTAEEYAAVATVVEEQLAAKGASLDATFFCPHHPEVSGPCDCRKPGLKLYREAARRFGIDFSGSIFMGDRPGDLLPARELGGRGILVLTGEGRRYEGEARREGFTVAADLAAATDLVLAPTR